MGRGDWPSEQSPGGNHASKKETNFWNFVRGALGGEHGQGHGGPASPYDPLTTRLVVPRRESCKYRSLGCERSAAGSTRMEVGMLNRRQTGGLWLCMAAFAAVLIAACSSSGSGGNNNPQTTGGPRTQIKSKNPAQVLDGHVSVLPSTADGGGNSCPDGFKGCSDGGCCPQSGACAANFTCEVAPTACATCTAGSSSGRCCQGNCCPDGSSCGSSGLCETKSVESTVACDSNNTQPCAGACCPAGSTCNNGVCDIHGSTPPQCDAGAELCDHGECCTVGYSCPTAGNSYCEKTPDPPAVSTTSGTCSAGDVLILPKGGNCPAINSSNSYYMKAMCCPKGSTLYCQYPTSSSPEPTCLVPPVSRNQTGVCGSGLYAAYDSYNSSYACCPYTNSLPSVGDLDGDGTTECYYYSNYTPTCSTGSVDPTTGKCCASGVTAGSGTCCPSDTSVCGSGCCPSGDYCTTDGKCQSYTTTSPTCPTDSARRCSQNDGSTVCCPLDTTCGPNGTCSCPLGASYDCGSFCATDSTACGCPTDHPDLCGGTCCLSGGCSHYNSSSIPDTCSCPSGNTCGAAGCCPVGSQCGTVNGESICYQCPDTTDTLCGKNCCALGESCVQGECVKCHDSAPNVCGKTCCTNDEDCVSGTCKPSSTTHTGSGGSGSGGATCTGSTQACAGCTYKICVSGSGTSSCSAYVETSSGRQTCSDCGAGCSKILTDYVSSCCGSATAAAGIGAQAP